MGVIISKDKDSEISLLMENEKRKAKLLKSIEYRDLFLVEVIREDKGHWYNLKERLIVKKYPFQATEDGTTTYCHCNECETERKGKKLYDMYEVAWAEEPIKKKISKMITVTKIGAIIPVDACKIIKKIK